MYKINQGDHIINQNYPAEQVDGLVMWRESEYSFGVLDLKTMALEDIFKSGSALDHKNYIQCAWK